MIFDEFEMEKSVKLAADVLDEMYPQWYEAINLDQIYMEDSVSCVLGQLGRSMNNEFTYPADEKDYSSLFSDVADRVGDDPDVLVAFDLEATEAGADAAYNSGGTGWTTLREVWRRAIRERL